MFSSLNTLCVYEVAINCVYMGFLRFYLAVAFACYFYYSFLHRNFSRCLMFVAAATTDAAAACCVFCGIVVCWFVLLTSLFVSLLLCLLCCCEEQVQIITFVDDEEEDANPLIHSHINRKKNFTLVSLFTFLVLN